MNDAESPAPEFSGTATYCPEDNKLRLYVGRVPRDEYLKLRAAGWAALHKQRETGGGDFAAAWTPERRDTALEYAGIIEDEDMGPEERAADRAERFSGYRDKREGEATGRADAFDAGPTAHGYQSQARADRSAARHDRIAGKAVDAWSKAEYWQRRTAGVISHALHKAAPGVRMGRIKELEADLRKRIAGRDESAQALAAWSVPGLTHEQAYAACCHNGGPHMARKEGDRPDFNQQPHASDALRGSFPNLYAPRTLEEIIPQCIAAYAQYVTHAEDWICHLQNRLAYESQMIEAQGGRAAFVEMIPGGWIGRTQIQKVNKSNATGRVVSVTVLAPTGANYDRKGKPYSEDNPRPMTLHVYNVERLPADSYRAPTAEELAAFGAEKKARKAAAPKADPCPLSNPTDADAERLAAMWNAARKADHEKKNIYSSESARAMHAAQFKPCEVRKMPQAFYSEHSKGAYAKVKTRKLCSLGRLEERNTFYDYSGQAERAKERGPALCQIRTTGFDPVHIIILTDKPQKPLPESVWQEIAAEVVA